MLFKKNNTKDIISFLSNDSNFIQDIKIISPESVPHKPGLGLGGKLGSGKQWWSWITLHDQIRAMIFLMILST